MSTDIHVTSILALTVLCDVIWSQRVTPVKKMKSLQPVEDGPPPNVTQSKTEQPFGPHVQTRAADLHKQGIYGQGVKIALIDSGVDCSHPALGGGFGKGYKIQFGYDLVGDAYNGENEPTPRASPCTQCAVS